MEQEQRILCSNLKIAKQGNYPPLACKEGFNPKIYEGVIWAGVSCTLVKDGYCSNHCERILQEPTSPAVLPQDK
jgi:hypothetical protein